VMAVAGGLASVWGAIFGAATIRILGDEILPRLENVDALKAWHVDYLNIIIYALLLILVMIFMPQGLFLGLKDAIRRWQPKFSRKGATP